MSLKGLLVVSALLFLLPSPNVFGARAGQQTARQKEASRAATRERLRKLLEAVGPGKEVGVTFRQHEKNPFAFYGVMGGGLSNADRLELAVFVTEDETISFRIYPIYKGGYINPDKVKNGAGLMRQLLRMNDTHFLFWGADNANDVFAGYTFTLESGFPAEAVDVVLRSVRNLDGFVGQLRPFIDAAPAPAK